MDVSLEPAFAAFSVPATVTPPEAEPIVTRGFWVSPMTEDFPGSADLQRREARRVMVLRRSEVPSVPRGTVIDAADIGSDVPQRWRVDGFERVEADHVRVVVVADPDET